MSGRFRGLVVLRVVVADLLFVLVADEEDLSSSMSLVSFSVDAVDAAVLTAASLRRRALALSLALRMLTTCGWSSRSSSSTTVGP